MSRRTARRGRTAVAGPAAALALALALALAGLVLAAPAASAARARVAPISATGAVEVTWTGAGVRGTARFVPGRGQAVVDRRTGRVTAAILPAAEPATVRVSRPGPGGAPVACAGTSPLLLPDAEAGSRSRRSRRALVGLPILLPYALGADRCAGPRPADLLDLLPKARTTSGPVGRRPVTVDLRSRRSGRAGPFAVQVTSTLRLRIGRVRTGRARSTPGLGDEDLGAAGDDVRRGRQVVLELAYAARGIGGSLVTDYRGTPAPGCEPLDACGLTGTRSLTMGPREAERFVGLSGLSLVATVPLRGRRPTTRRLLRDLRAGRLDAQVDFFLEGEGDGPAGRARTRQPGAEPCEDSGPAELPSTQAALRPEGLQVDLGPFGDFLNEDPLRSRCPGPTFEDVLGRAPLATGLIPTARLGDRELRLALRSEGAFAGGVYAGERRGELVVDLRRTRLRSSVVRP